MGSGNFTPARDPLFFIDAGMHVFGLNPWFWRKKMTRLGPPARLYFGSANAALAIPGNKAELKPDASNCKDFLRLIMMVSVVGAYCKFRM